MVLHKRESDFENTQRWHSLANRKYSCFCSPFFANTFIAYCIYNIRSPAVFFLSKNLLLATENFRFCIEIWAKKEENYNMS